MSLSRSAGLGLGMLVLLTGSAIGQSESEHFISAKAGMINYLEGDPQVVAAEKSMPSGLMLRSQLQAGDRLVLREGDRVEALLNPGSYLRLSGPAQALVIRTEFREMEFQVLEGVAILESSAFFKKVHGLRFVTPAGDVVIQNEGLYRVEVMEDRGVEFSVFKGKAQWVREGQRLAWLKKGKRFNLTASSPTELVVAKLRKDEADPFDRWSRRRAEYLVAVNSRLTPAMRDAVTQWGAGGGWVYNPFYRCYTFMPLDFGLGSPYGFSYRNVYPTYRSWSPAMSDWDRGVGRGSYGSTMGRSPSIESRSAATAAPSAPAARAETGRGDMNSRAGTFGRAREK
ncbi:MAG: hypothetical protein AB1898_23225 [Acidobacteriota bacterium]